MFYIYHKVKGDRFGGASYELVDTRTNRNDAQLVAAEYNSKIPVDKQQFHKAVVRIRKVQQT